MAWKLLQVGTVYDDFYAKCRDDSNLQDAIDARMAQLLQKGNLTREPLSKPLGDRLFELRADSAKHRARILYGFLPDQRIVVVDARFKDQRTLPQPVINAAKRMVRLLREGEVLANATTTLH